MLTKFFFLVPLLWIATVGQAQTDDRDSGYNVFNGLGNLELTRSSYYGYECADLSFAGRACKIVRPAVAAKGHPWIWRARFWGHEPQTEIALLQRGFAVVYCDVAELFGNQEAIGYWNDFYQLLQKAGLAKKGALEGMSRGGVYVYNWAMANPDKVACIYADAPVLDLKSWPGGKGKGPGSKQDWELFKKDYGLTDEAADHFSNSPLDNAAKIARLGIPMLHVVGDADEVVPLDENTNLFEQKIKEAGGNIKVIHKPGVGHHPHSLRDPTPIVDFILEATGQKIVAKVSGGVRLPAVLSSNMVLQRESRVALWGWCDCQEKIIVTTSWDNHNDTVTGTGYGNWRTYINTPVAGGPYTITFKGKNTIVLQNVMIGEVWVCSGQSNMEWSSNQNIQQIIDELPNCGNSRIRLFKIPKITSVTPQDNLPGEWQSCYEGSLKGFSAVGYFFGKKLEASLHVPIGLIDASWGGTAAENWTPAEVVSNDPVLNKAASEQKPADWWPATPGSIYNAMIYPLANFSIAGAIWYQGESNTVAPALYSRLLTAMISSWRKTWQKDIPFYYVQIAPFKYANRNVGALVREQQVKTMASPGTGMVVITDLVDNVNDIHPQNKRDVGMRLANYALAETYKRPIGVYKSPVFKSMEINGDKAVLSFENAASGFATNDKKEATEFYVAGSDKIFLPATVKLEKDRIIVYSKQIKQPVAVRFAFGNTAISNLFNKEGLPVCPFRTDDWDVDTSRD